MCTQLFVTSVRLHGFAGLKARQLVNTSFTHAQTFDCYVHSTVPQATFFVSYRTSSLHVIISLTDSQQPGIHLSIGQSRLQTSCCIIRCIIDSGLSCEVDDKKYKCVNMYQLVATVYRVLVSRRIGSALSVNGKVAKIVDHQCFIDV